MSTIYDNWERLVGAVLKREDFRRLALRDSFSTSISSDFSSHPSFDADPTASEDVFVTRNIKAIQFEELKLATRNFQPDGLLGEGRFGPVYKGWIHEHFLTAVKPGSGIAVAIRKLNKSDIYYLNRPHHPNLVKLIGYGFEEGKEGNNFLVYKFMPNGSLDNHLFTRRHQPLSWETRIRVAVGAARGLSFFHDLGITVTHTNVKTSSILLDDEFNANLSDFDLAVDAPGSSIRYALVKNHYSAPEYVTTGFLTMESDVFSFGVVLLELLSGLRVHDQHRLLQEQDLVVWAKPYLGDKRKPLQIVDSRLEECPHDGAYKLGNLASECLSLDPKRRPRMNEVVEALEQLQCLNAEVKLSSPLPVAPSHHQKSREQTSPTGIDIHMDQEGSSNWCVVGPGNDIQVDQAGPSSFPVLSPDVSSQGILVSRNVMLVKSEVRKRATVHFRLHNDMILREGGSFQTYKGWIDEHYLTTMKPGSGIAVAVNVMNDQGDQGPKELVNEVRYLSHLHHPNLVELIGYSFNTDNRAVVYEFMPNGSLDNHLFTSGHQGLPWSIRVRVALGAARALAFLHDLKSPVVHRIFKCEDILLDGNFNTKLLAFGLARDGTRVSTLITGSYGYAAPEHILTGCLSTGCDVYGFGAILLELISGRRVYNKMLPEGERNLINWARPYLKEKRRMSRLMDGRLQGKCSSKEAYKVAKIALQCVSTHPRLRPSMAEVVAALEKTKITK